MGTPAQLILVDSDILIDASRQDAAAVDWLDQRRPEIAVSTITHIELLSGCRDKREWRLTQGFLARFELTPSMTEGSYEVAIIPADDLDGAHSVMRRTLADARRRYPAARLRADYTGGTKTMTAALVLAALEDDDIELQLVAGSRADLVRVAEGTQASVAAAVEGVRLRRAMRAHLTAWQRHAYGEAAAGCRSRATPACVQRWPARATSPLLSPRGTISTMPAPPAYCSTPMSPSPPSPCAIM